VVTQPTTSRVTIERDADSASRSTYPAMVT
jgi:hypothetical protein